MRSSLRTIGLGLSAAVLLATAIRDAPAQELSFVPGASNLRAEAVSGSRIDLSWNPPSSPQVVEFHIYYSDGTLRGTVPVPQTSFSDTGLQPWTVYRYYVTAANAGGNESGPSNVATARTLDETPPSQPVDLKGAVTGPREITLTWGAASDRESGIEEYVVYRDDAERARTAVLSFVDGSLDADRQYAYKVTAINGQGLEGAPGGPIQVRTPVDEAPDPPRDLTATAVAPDVVLLDWNAPADDDDIEGYRVYRDGSPIATTSGTDYQDTGLSPFTTYEYRVTTIGEDGDESAPSDAVVVRTPDDSPPSTPTDLTAVAVGAERVDLTWSASEDPESGIQFYRVYRDGSEIGTSVVTSYQDEGLSPGTTYEYRVSAVNGDDLESEPSASAFATTPDGTGPTAPTDLVALPVATDGIDLTWSPSSDPESGISFYRVFRDGLEVATSVVTGYQDTGLSPGTTYAYRVSAVNGEGLESALSEAAVATTLDEPGPPPPVDVVASPLNPTQVELTWTAPSAEITGYNIYRDGTFAGTVTGTAFVDTGLTPETTYRYAVASLAGAVQGERSAEVEATTLSAEDRVPPAPPTGLRVVGP